MRLHRVRAGAAALTGRVPSPSIVPASLTAACALILLAAAPGYAQQTGDIRGQVEDPSGAALPGVTVTAASPSLQGVRTTVSDATGRFRVPLLPVGTYTLTFELDGFDRLLLSGQEVLLGFTSSVRVGLKLAGRSEEITVKAEAPLIDKVQTDTSYRLSSTELDRIPTQAKTIAEVVGLTPGVTGVRVNTMTGGGTTAGRGETGLPSFRGEGDAGNNWLVDGLSTKGALSNDPGVRVNYDAWEEVQIISDSFSAELGNAVGGFVNVVTRSGGNAFRGEGGGLFRNEHLRAGRKEQLSAASLPETSLNQFFGNVGGPIAKDRLWFFVSDNVFQNVDTTTEQTIDWLTIPAGERHVNTNNIFGKLTYSPRSNHTTSLTAGLDTLLGQSGGIGIPETYTKTDHTDAFIRANYRGVLSDTTLVAAAVGWNQRDRTPMPLSGGYGPPSYFWQDIGQRTNAAYAFETSRESRSDLSAGFTRYADAGRWGAHEIKAGGSYYWNSYHSTVRYSGTDADPWPGNGFDSGAGLTWAEPGLPMNLSENGAGGQRDNTRGLGIYVQDNITRGRVSLTAGLRSDTQAVFNDAGTNVWTWGLGDFWQPRVSLAVDLTADGANVVKAGFGQFAMPLSQDYLMWVNGSFLFNFRNYEWVGPENPSGAQLVDPVQWSFLWEQSGEATPVSVDPEIRPNRVNKFLLQFDRRLRPGWALKFRGIRSWSRDLLEDIAVYAPESASGLNYTFTNFEHKKRDYSAFEAELVGRIADRFRLNASYTWSHGRGSTSGNGFESGSWDVMSGGGYDGGPFGDRPDVPAGAPEKELFDMLFTGLGGRGIGDEGWYGFLPYSVDHTAKVLATWLAPRRWTVSSSIEFLSGYHWEKKGWVEGYGGYMAFPETRGVRVSPAHLYVDVAADKAIALTKQTTLILGVSVYNILNSQQPVSFVKEDTDLFGTVWARQLPTWVQLKASVRF